MNEIINFTNNFEAIRDAGVVYNCFKDLQDLMAYGAGQSLIVKGFKYPFTIQGRFDGDGVAVIHVFHDKEDVNVYELYDSHRCESKFDCEHLFRNLSISAYKKAAATLIGMRIDNDNGFIDEHEKDWAIRFQSYIVESLAADISLTAEGDEVSKNEAIAHMSDMLYSKVELLNKIVSK